MRKKNLIFLAVFFFVTVSEPLPAAERDTDLIFYLNSGVTRTFAPDNLERFWKNGPTLGGGIGYPVDDRYTVQAYIEYNRLGFNSDRFIDPANQGTTVSGNPTSILTATINLKIKTGKPGAGAAPYFIGGAGLFSIAGGDTEVTGSVGISGIPDTDKETAVHVGFGLGIDFKIRDNATIFIEARGSIGNTESYKVIFVPFKVGVSFGGR